jgi:hypothetical protein
LIALFGLALATPAFCKNVEGTVASIRPGLLTINTWGTNQMEDFQTDAGIALENFRCLDCLRLGDKVSVDYYGGGYLKTAVGITKETSVMKITVL